MSELHTYVKLLTDYGIMLVLSGIVLYIMMKIVNINLARYEQYVNRNKHDKALDLKFSIDQQVYDCISQLLESSEIDRVLVIGFSNSVQSVAYLPYKYMECNYEVHNIDKTDVGHKIKQLNTSLFSRFFTILHNNDYCIFDINRDSYMGGAMQELMQAQNEHHALCILLKTSKGKPIGYLQLTSDSNRNFSNNTIDNALTTAQKVSALLSVMDK